MQRCYSRGAVSATRDEVYGKSYVVGVAVMVPEKNVVTQDNNYAGRASVGEVSDSDNTVRMTGGEPLRQETYAGFDFKAVWRLDLGQPRRLRRQTPLTVKAGDVNGDGMDSVSDVRLALRATIGKVSLRAALPTRPAMRW